MWPEMPGVEEMPETAAVAADLARLDRDHPAWHAWRSEPAGGGAQLWYATRRGRVLSDSAFNDGLVMTIGGQEDPGQLDKLLTDQDRKARDRDRRIAAGGRP
jgi:hypothetical protein